MSVVALSTTTTLSTADDRPARVRPDSQHGPTPVTNMDPVPAGSAVSTTMRWASSFFLACFFLYLGLQIRRIKALRIFSVPAAVGGGFLGLIFLQLCKLNDSVYQVVRYDWVLGWSAMPSILINVVFASLFLGKTLPSGKQMWREGGPQVMYGQIIAWGNWSVSTLITGAILIPAFGVSPLFASMYAVGFEGGHGTAGGLKESYAALGYPEYGDVAVTSATIGILMGSVVGVCLVNWGIATNRLEVQKDGAIDAAKGNNYKLQGADKAEKHGDDDMPAVSLRSDESSVRVAAVGSKEQDTSPAESDDGKVKQGCSKFCARDAPPDLYEEDSRPSAGVQTTREDAMESTALHLAYIAFSIFFGYVVLRCLWLIEDQVPALQEIRFFRSFPLFPMCMLGGLFIMWLHKLAKAPIPVDSLVMERLSGAAMEFLIVTAIATINTDAVANALAPLAIILVGGISWNFVCFFVLAPRMLPDAKFERAIVELGQSFGTTATGLLLLRICDPEKETTAWRAFSYKQLMTEPFMGGGIWTTVSLPMLATLGVWPVFGISSAFLAFWFVMYFVYFRRVYARQAAEAQAPSTIVVATV
eukprot:jgi/Tetstr1/440032/TSEL_028392.t1